ncbi:uncharacterized protein P884DRAFT_281212 [Thermothelomyces heterothallicus CBS 202.75]|uniref:uncharacterized protein n=1 Tax=Thermothelomyces heterothallicus CBS 202.75 TaxID=1149848 RepID=UPI00374280C7
MSSRAAPIHGLDPEEKVEATLVWDGRSSPDFERDVCLEDLIHDFPISIPYPRALWAPAHRALPHLPGLLRRAAIFLLPSFIQPLVSRSKSGPFPSSSSSQHGRCLGPTAYLDGIRGLAAVAVFFYPPLLLPFVRLAFSGPPMVRIFFVVGTRWRWRWRRCGGFQASLVLLYAGMVHLGVRRILAGCRCPRRELCEVAGGEMFDL